MCFLSSWIFCNKKWWKPHLIWLFYCSFHFALIVIDATLSSLNVNWHLRNRIGVLITHPKVLFQHCLTNLTKLPFVKYSTNFNPIRIQVGLTMTWEYFWYTLYIQNMTNVASLAWKLNHHQSYANQVKSVKFLLGVGNLIFFCKIAKSLIYVSV